MQKIFVYQTGEVYSSGTITARLTGHAEAVICTLAESGNNATTVQDG
jgi:hypothetical protein